MDEGGPPSGLRYILGDLEREPQPTTPADEASWSPRKRYAMTYFRQDLFPVTDLPSEEEAALKEDLLNGRVSRKEVESWQ